MDDLRGLSQIVETGDCRSVKPAVKNLADRGYSPEEIMRLGLIPGMQRVGDKFENHIVFIPEMLSAARAFKFGCEALRAHMPDARFSRPEKVLIGTVQGDLHDLGKNLVSMFMQGGGFEVIDLGVDVPPDQFVRMAERDEAIRFVALSALLTTTLPSMKETIQALRKSKAAGRITILAGGGPVNWDLARKMDADIYTEDAVQAVRAVIRCVETD